MRTSRKQTLSFLCQYAGQEKALLVLSVLCALVNVAATLVIPVLFGRAIDHMVGIGEVDFGAIRYLLIVAGALTLLAAISHFLLGVICNRLTFRIAQAMRVEVMAHLHTLPISYFDTHTRGEVLTRVVSDIETVSDGLLLAFSQFISGILTIFGTLGIMFYINWLVALVVLVLTPLSLFVARYIARRVQSTFREQAALRAKQTTMADEWISNQKTLQNYLYNARAEAQFDAISAELERVARKALFASSLTNPCTRCVNAIVYAMVALVGGLSAAGILHLGAGALTVGSLGIMLSYAGQYTKPFNEISGVVTELQNAMVCGERVHELLCTPGEENGELSQAAIPDQSPLVGDVSIRNVGFRYTPDKPLIDGFNLQVGAGQRVAIVGPTGCGKTTIINLLMRFYDVVEGEIYIDGAPIRAIPRSAHRARIGMVLQDTWIRHATVRENVAIGKEGATDQEIIEACQKAHADGFIRRLPHGYDTIIDDGNGLSNGQKQLLCIARLMLALPPMLILDEATSSIDTRTEQRIQKAFHTLMQGKTSFIVAHRLSTIREADLIVVMKDGHIMEQGNHDSLMEKHGFYRALYESGI